MDARDFDPRDFAKGNTRGSGMSISIEPLVYTSPMTTNWGVPAVPRLVALDPQLGALEPAHEGSAEPQEEPMGRAASRRRMAELADEFATMHDELLRELAR